MMRLFGLLSIVLFFSTSAELVIPNNFGVDFHHSMAHGRKYSQKGAEISFSRAKKIYDDYINNIIISEEPLIPKIIHQIWLGPKPLPEKEKEYAQTWIKYHPDWEYKLWTEKELAEFGLKNKKAFNVAISYGEKANIARYEILYRIGGLYVDTDYECLFPMDHLHYTCECYVGLTNQPYFYTNNAIIASVPGHPLLKNLVNNVKPRDPRDNKLSNSLHRTGPTYLTNWIKKMLSNGFDRIIIFPSTYFYPLPAWKRLLKTAQKQRWYCPESFAVHHWHVAWEKNPARK